MCPEQDCESLVYMSDQNTSMIESIGLHEHPFWKERVEKFYGWFHKFSKTSKDAWTWEEGQTTSIWSGTRGSSRRHQSVPINPADRPNPEETPLPWKDIGDLDTSMDHLYPVTPSMEECPVEKVDHLETEQQQPYMRWIEKTLVLDRRTTKDPRLYCAYCDMNNHPRFSCKHAYKHAYKHRNPDARHRCTLCAGRHPPFLCPKAQVNDGDAKPSWYKVEYKRAKQDGREPDYRWGENVSHVDVDPPVEDSQLSSRKSTASMCSSRNDARCIQASSKLMAGWLSHHCRTSRMDASSATAICDLSESRVQDRGQSMES